MDGFVRVLVKRILWLSGLTACRIFADDIGVFKGGDVVAKARGCSSRNVRSTVGEISLAPWYLHVTYDTEVSEMTPTSLAFLPMSPRS